MRSPAGGTLREPLVEPLSPRAPGSADGEVHHSVHLGRTIEVVTAALPSGGFVILHIRVMNLERRWTRVSSGSFWSFESRTAAASHGRSRAVFAIDTQRI